MRRATRTSPARSSASSRPAAAVACAAASAWPSGAAYSISSHAVVARDGLPILPSAEGLKTAKIPPRMPPARIRGRSRWPSRPPVARPRGPRGSARRCGRRRPGSSARTVPGNVAGRCPNSARICTSASTACSRAAAPGPTARWCRRADWYPRRTMSAEERLRYYARSSRSPRSTRPTTRRRPSNRRACGRSARPRAFALTSRRIRCSPATRRGPSSLWPICVRSCRRRSLRSATSTPAT